MSTDEKPQRESWYSRLNDEEREDLVTRVATQLDGQKGTKLPRRDLLKAAGVGAAGLSLGAGAVASDKINADDIMHRASAQSAAAGQVGTASEPVDVFASVVDTDELSVSSQAAQIALDGYVVPVGPGVGVGDAIDPSTTTTPVQDALDLAYVDGTTVTGAILPDYVEESGGTLLPKTRQHLIPATGGMEIEFSGAGSGGIDLSNCSDNFGWTGHLKLTGPGTGAAPAFQGGSSNTRNVSGDRLRTNNFEGTTVIDGSNMFQVHIGLIDIFRADPAGNWIVEDFPGTGSTIGTLGVYGSAENSGTDADAVKIGGSASTITAINLGEALNKGVLFPYNVQVNVGRVNYEANSQVSGPGDYVVCMESAGMHRVAGVDVSQGDVTDAILLETGSGFVGPDKKYIAYTNVGSGTATNVINVASNPSGEGVITENPSSDVNNTTGSSLSYGVSCLADMVNKTSTGTGP